MTNVQYMNGEMASDSRFVEVRTKNGTVTGIRQKVMDYIYFSAITGSQDALPGSCATNCGKGIFSQKCCAGIKAEGDAWYACVDRSFAPGDMTMTVANVDVNIKCVESGAIKMAGLTASAILVLASTM